MSDNDVLTIGHNRIIAARAKGSTRTSRQASPAVVGQPPTNPFQSFQPPPSAGGFNFSMPGSTPSPAFGQAAPPPRNGISFGTAAPNQEPNGTPSFGGFGNNQNNNTPSFGSGLGSNITPSQPNGFNPTPSFSFGQTQTNGNTTTPASSFTFGQTQSQSQEPPKQNGFKPSTTFSFGSQQSQQQNGGTPAVSFGQSQPQEQQTPKPSMPSFSGFGQTPQQNGKKPASTGLFGSIAPTEPTPKTSESIFSGLSGPSNGIKPGMFTASQTNGEQTPKPSTPFAGFNFGQQEKDKQAAEPPKPSLNFGQQHKENEQQTPKPAFSFGQPNKPSEEQTPKATFSFGQQNKQSEEQTPKPSFTGFGQQPSQPPGEQTPKPSNAFSGFKFGQQEQPAAEKPTEQQTPKPAGNLFSGLNGSQPNGTSAFKFGASQQEDTSMLSPENTPQKQASGLLASQPAAPTEQPATSEPETPANPNTGTSLFDRLSRDPPASAPKPSLSFGAPPASSDEQHAMQGKTLFDRLTPREPEPPATAPKISSAPFSMPATSSAPAPPLFKTPAAPQAFMQPAQHPASTATAIGSAVLADRTKLKELNEGTLTHLRSEDTSQDWSVIFHYYIDQAAKLMGNDAVKAPSPTSKAMPAAPSNAFGSANGGNTSPVKPSAPPAGMVRAQAPAPPGHSNPAPTQMMPATPIAGNIFSQAAKPPATAPVNRKRSADDDLTRDTATPEQPATDKRPRPSESVQYPKLPETASKTAQLFASTLERPADNAINRLGPPDAAYNEVQKQKAAKEAAQKAEAEKPAAAAPSAFKPSTTFKFGAPAQDKPAETPKAPSFGLTPSVPAPEKPAEPPKARSFGFTPITASPPAPAPGGFKPTFTAPAAGSANFLSAFGKKAESEQEKEKRKRMDDDYDSDEEDKATWEAKYKAEQEEKRRMIEEAAKSGPVFSFPASAKNKPAASTPFAFKPAGGEKAGAETEESANPNAGKSLFDRITPAEKEAEKTPAASTQTSMFSVQTPAKSTSNVFGSKPSSTPFGSGFSFGQTKPATNGVTDKSQAEREQGSGNNTWKPSTPIKFGAPTGNESTTPAAPPPANPFAGLFGVSATSANKSELSKLAPPTVGFTFGGPKGASADVSRATTPGVTTDGEASTAGDAGDRAEGESSGPSDQQNDQQIEDMTRLLPEERENEEVLFETSVAKAMKLDEKQTTTGWEKGWVEKGKGPLYVLKNRTTGKTRVLLKIPPLGRPAMNFGPMKGMKYDVSGNKMTIVVGPFMDHFETSAEKKGKPSTWRVQVKEPGEAKDIARILGEEKERQ